MVCTNITEVSEADFDLNHLEKHRANDVIVLFNQCFKVSEETELIGYCPEPEYLPKKSRNEATHAICFTNDYFASALHEISHWCIAGKKRRLLPDYGYWYCPDGRTSEEQSLFEKVEVVPQALEWLFAEAAEFPFRLSFDNLNGSPVDAIGFADNVYQQAHKFLNGGVNERSQQFIEALLSFYRKGQTMDSNWFKREKLGFLE